MNRNSYQNILGRGHEPGNPCRPREDARQSCRHRVRSGADVDRDARLLARIAWSTNMATSAYDAFHEVLGAVCEHTSYPVGHAYMVAGSDRDEAIPASIWHGAEGVAMQPFREVSEGMVAASKADILGRRIIARRAPVQIRDMSVDESYLRGDQARAAGLRGAFGIPILVAEQVLAALEFYTFEPRELDADTLQLVDACGVMLGRAVERHLMAIEIDKRTAQLEQAQKITDFGTWEWTLATDQVTWSPQLYRIYGVDPVAFDGTFEGHLGRLAPGERERMRAGMRQALERQSAFFFEERLAAQGTIKHLHYRGEVVIDPAGEPVRLVGVCQDVTLLRQARERERQLSREQTARHVAENKAEELARLTRELERRNRELDQFAYVASHDLKAPLRGIGNLSGWLEEDLGDQLDDKCRKHLELLRGRVNRMEALIDALLAYSRAGRKQAQPEAVDVRGLLDEIIDLLAPGEGVDVAIVSVMPTFVTTRILLQQVFHNLIDNALKHGRAQSCRIEVGASDAGEFYEFWVKDEGPGIAARYQGKIWEIFQTLRARDKVEGTGIGLALVKKIIEQQGGVVGVDSAPDKGARFYFLWPKHVEVRG
jgi:signal transduction histidine kinase